MQKLEEFKPIISALLMILAVFVILWILDKPTESKIKDTTILLNNVKVKQAEIDSLKKQLFLSDKTIQKLKSKRNEIKYIPLQRPIFTDSLRAINIQRFY